MTGQMILALGLAIPVILIAAAFVWYLNISGIYTVVREKRMRATAGVEAK